MLKSELVISEDLDLLDSHLEQYSIRFITSIFSDENSLNIQGNKKELNNVFTMMNSPKYKNADIRTKLIPQMIKDRDFLEKTMELILK
jgi:hypothetical protein